jgi:hypothetical protein
MAATKVTRPKNYRERRTELARQKAKTHIRVHHRTTNQGHWRTSTKAITLEEYKQKNPGTVRDDAIEDEDQQRPLETSRSPPQKLPVEWRESFEAFCS